MVTTGEILSLDYREERSERIVQRALLRIKPLSKYEDDDEHECVPLYAMERLIHKICYRYDVSIKDIRIDSKASKSYPIYRCEIISSERLDSLKVIFAMCLYELYAKVVIFLWTEKGADRLKRRSLK